MPLGFGAISEFSISEIGSNPVEEGSAPASPPQADDSPQQPFLVSEEIVPAAATNVPYEDVVFVGRAAPPPIIVTASVGEDFVFTPAAGLDDGGAPAILPVLDAPPGQFEVDEQIVASATTIVIETPGWVWLTIEPPPSWSPSPPEDFAGSLPLEENAVVAVVVPDLPPIVVADLNEYFGGVHPTEEVAVWVWPPPELSAAAPSIPEDFAGSLPQEEPFAVAWLAPELQPLTPVTWLPEDFVGYLVVDETAPWVWMPPEPLPAFILPVPEDFQASVPIDEIPALVTPPPEIVWLTPTVSEEFGGAHPTEEPGVPPLVLPEKVLLAIPRDEDFSGILTVADELPGAVWLEPVPPIVLAAIIPEDFAGSLAFEEPPGWFALPPELSWLGIAQPEDFVGYLPIEEPSGWVPPLLVDVQLLGAPPPEDFAGSLPLEEPSGWVWPPQETTWISIAPAEEFAGSGPFDEAPGLAQIFDADILPLVLVADEDFAGSAPIDEQPALTWVAPEVPWLAVAASDEDIAAPTVVDEQGVPAQIIRERVWLTPPIVDEVVVASSFALDEYALPPPLPVQGTWLTIPVSEEFAIVAAIVDEYGLPPQRFALVSPWLVPATSEDITVPPTAVVVEEGSPVYPLRVVRALRIPVIGEEWIRPVVPPTPTAAPRRDGFEAMIQWDQWWIQIAVERLAQFSSIDQQAQRVAESVLGQPAVRADAGALAREADRVIVAVGDGAVVRAPTGGWLASSVGGQMGLRAVIVGDDRLCYLVLNLGEVTGAVPRRVAASEVIGRTRRRPAR